MFPRALTAAVLVLAFGTQARQNPAVHSAAPPAAMTNIDVVKLVRAGFSDETIATNIRRAKRRAFQLDADALIALKSAGVSEAIIKVMMNPEAAPSAAPALANAVAPRAPSTALPPPPPSAVHSVGSATGLETLPSGIYFAPADSSAGAVALEPTVFSSAGGSFWKTGLTYGIAKSKFTARVSGAAAHVRIPAGQARFYFVFSRKSADLGESAGFGGWMASATSANEFTLVEMTRKADRRELVVGEYNAFTSNSGMQSKDVVPVSIVRIAPGIYRVTTDQILQGGEYCFFYAAGIGTFGQGVVGKLFDFGVTAAATGSPHK